MAIRIIESGLSDSELLQIEQAMHGVRVPHGVTKDYVLMTGCEIFNFDRINKINSIHPIDSISIKQGNFILIFTRNFPKFIYKKTLLQKAMGFFQRFKQKKLINNLNL